MTPSKYQSAIYDHISSQGANLSVNAVAGSGKTTTLVHAAGILPPDQHHTFLAFSKPIADTLAARLPQHCRASTVHALGRRAWMGLNPGCETEPHKMRAIIKELVPSWEIRSVYGRPADKLVSLAKANLLTVENDEQSWIDIIENYGMGGRDIDPAKLVWLARRALQRSLETCEESIDFDDMVYLPVLNQMDIGDPATVFVDEAQDLNPVQHGLIGLMRGSRLIMTGDPHQCQPAGTMVRIPGGKLKPIEAVRVGDLVVSVDIAHSCFKATGDRVTAVEHRKFSGRLIRIESAGRASLYTSNHRCIVNAKPLEKKFAVYMMQRGDTFRIGSTQIGTGSGCGVRTRLCNEGADKAWILEIHDTKQMATSREAQIAFLFNIPERTFVSQTANGTQGLNQSFLDGFWAFVGSLYSHQQAALRVLNAYGRSLNYPLISKDVTKEFNVRRPSEVRACNLMPGMLVLHSEEKVQYKRHDWKPVETVTGQPYSGFVYSLQIESKETYIADGIATHNSIFAWRGADKQSFNNLKSRWKCDELPLSVCYRCPVEVVKLAKEIVPQIEWHDLAQPGRVEWLDQWGPGTMNDDDVVLCRNNAPLVRLAYALIKAGRGCRMQGRDFAGQLTDFVERFKEWRLASDALREMERWVDDERRKLEEKYKFEQADSLMDKLGCVSAVIEGMRANATVAELLFELGVIFADSNSGLTLSTIHRAKGLEWNRVFILEPGLMPARWATQPWEIEQEHNLRYVAITRAKRELYWVNWADFNASRTARSTGVA